MLTEPTQSAPRTCEITRETWPSGDDTVAPLDTHEQPDSEGGRGHLVTRRRLIIGGSAVVVLGVGGALVEQFVPVRSVWRRLTGACGLDGADAPRSAAAVISDRFSSTVLGHDVGFSIGLPPGATPNPTTPMPVCFCLPGRGGVAADVTAGMRLQDFVAAEVARGAPTTFAVAGIDGGESYWHRRADGTDTLAMFLDEFMPLASQRFGLGTGTAKRALLGWSMGGYGALLAAERRPELFSAVAAASPAIWRTYEDQHSAVPDAFDGPDDFAANDVFRDVARLQGLKVRIDCGTSDPFAPAAQQLATAIQPAPEGRYEKGCHDGGFWRRVAPDQVRFLSSALK